MNILVTGASGFVGSALASALLDDGHTVVSVVRDWTRAPRGVITRGDVTDGEFCRRVLADYEIDAVYHLAAQAIVSACAEDPVTALEVATMGTARLLQAVREARRPIRVVVSTSDKVYGSAPAPYTEETPLDAHHAYEVSKACQDLIARMFHANYGLDVRVVRAVNIYGPGDPNESRLVPRTALRLLRGEPPLLHDGAAQMRRQYVYIDDVISALRAVYDRGEPGAAYCIGSPDSPMTVIDVMQRMAEIANVPFTAPEVKARSDHFHEIAAQSVCDDKLRGLGWSPGIRFAEGIRRTFDWYKQTAGRQKMSLEGDPTC